MSALRSFGNLLLTVVLAPGIASHECAHWLACRLFGVEVTGGRALNPFAGDAYLDHERVESFPADFAIAVAPLALNTVLAVVAFLLAEPLRGSTAWFVVAWVGATLALSAFPSDSDTNTLLVTVENLPVLARPVGYLLALPVRGFALVPWSGGLGGYVWIAVCYRVATPPIGTI